MKKITEKRLNDNNSIGSSFDDFLVEEGICPHYKNYLKIIVHF
jgi:hypothetical protein